MKKTTKKIVSVLLVVAMLVSLLAIGASAADEATASFSIESCKVTKYADNDKETVMQLQLKVAASGDKSAVFDSFDSNAKITIYDGAYIELYGMIGELMSFSDSKIEEIKNSAIIAFGKPVEYNDGILPTDVVSKDGKTGAKMIAIGLDSYININADIFEFPEGILIDSKNNIKNEYNGFYVAVEGLEVKTVKLPSLIKKVITNLENEDIGSLIFTLLPILPIAFIVLPILLSTTVNRFQKVYNVYGISLKSLKRDANKIIFNIIPILINNLF